MAQFDMNTQSHGVLFWNISYKCYVLLLLLAQTYQLPPFATYIHLDGAFKFYLNLYVTNA